MYSTYYYTAVWEDYPGNKTSSIRIQHDDGKIRTHRVTPGFKTNLGIEGSGWLGLYDATGTLTDVITVNYWKSTYYHTTSFTYGHGSKPTDPLIPYQSVANGGRYAKGTWMCIPSTVGVSIPYKYRGAHGAAEHSGWWKVVDAGGAINSTDFDLFVGAGLEGFEWAKSLLGAKNRNREVHRGITE
jgi:hypothetical protein